MIKLPKSLTTVTTLSKSVALLLLIALPFIGFMMGVKYQAAVDHNFQLSNIDYSLNYKVSPTAGSAVGKVTITEGDRGKIVMAHVGNEIIFSLRSGFTWKVNFSNRNIVKQINSNNSQLTYEAVKQGTTLVTLVGDPACYPHCMIPSAALSLTLTVK